MSAWIVSRRHIDYMVSAAARYDRHVEIARTQGNRLLPDVVYQWSERIDDPSIVDVDVMTTHLAPSWKDCLGRLWWYENHASVAYRYPNHADDLPGPVGLTLAEIRDEYQHILHLDPVVVLKAIDCWRYQSCEHPGHEKSAAWRLAGTLMHITIYNLPGYDAAPWGIDEGQLRL